MRRPRHLYRLCRLLQDLPRRRDTVIARRDGELSLVPPESFCSVTKGKDGTRLADGILPPAGLLHQFLPPA